jgi:hypothetical protein
MESDIPESISLSELSSILNARKQPAAEASAAAQETLLRRQLEEKLTAGAQSKAIANAQETLIRKQLEEKLAEGSASSQETLPSRGQLERMLEKDLGAPKISPEKLQAAKEALEAKLPKLMRLSKQSRERLFAEDARLIQDDVTVEGAGAVRRLLVLLKAYSQGMDDRPWREELQVACTSLDSSLQVGWNLTVGLFRNEHDRYILEQSGQIERLMEIWKDFLTPSEHARKLYSLPLKFRGTFLCDFAPDGKVMSVRIGNWDLNGEALHLPQESFPEDAKNKDQVSEWAKSIFKLH